MFINYLSPSLLRLIERRILINVYREAKSSHLLTPFSIGIFSVVSSPIGIRTFSYSLYYWNDLSSFISNLNFSYSLVPIQVFNLSDVSHIALSHSFYYCSLLSLSIPKLNQSITFMHSRNWIRLLKLTLSKAFSLSVK